MIRTYIIEDSCLQPAEYTDALPRVYIPYKLFLKLYILNGDALMRAGQQISAMVGANKKCQIVPILKRDTVYHTLLCYRPDMRLDVPVKCTKVLGGPND